MSASDSSPRALMGISRLYGAAALTRFAAAHVCVVGIGGVGSWAAEALARSGIGTLTLIDLDHVAESNLNRQVHALGSTLGQAKVIAMAARIGAINPQCCVHSIEEFVSADNVATLLPACDAVVDAIDQVSAKAALIAHCRGQGRWIISVGGAGGRSDPTKIKVSDLARSQNDALLASLRSRLRKVHGFARDQDFGLPCVYSTEPVRRPLPTCDNESGLDPSAGLACAGYGSVVTVTASFGFTAAAQVLSDLVEKSI